jgi:hypothetical protein
MFDWTLPEKHAIAILKKDHVNVKALFDSFEDAKSEDAREKIIDEAVTALKAHAILEEDLFYPAVRKHVGSKIMEEADEEHHVAKVLIAELDRDGRGGDHRNAKFKVLSESVRHHIKEEESDMLPKAKQVDIDFEKLGAKMLSRRRDLLSKGFPDDAEHKMVARVHGRTDSPAVAAKRTTRSVRKRPSPAAR